MLKKMIFLLPLVWVVAIGAYLAHSPHSANKTNPALRGRPAILPLQMVVIHPAKADLLVYADLTGRHLISVGLGTHGSSLNGVGPILHVLSFRCRATEPRGGYTPVLISASSVRRLTQGFYPVRFDMSDGSSAYMTLMVRDRPLPGTVTIDAKPRPHCHSTVKVAAL